jgi:hypothetical protein
MDPQIRFPASRVSRPVRHLHVSRLKRNWDVRQRGLAPESNSHKSAHANAAIGFSGSIFAISQFAFFDVCAFPQATCPFRQLVPTDDAMPFGGRLVFVLPFSFQLTLVASEKRV